MSIFTTIIISVSKYISLVSRLMHMGSGATWPGEIALKFKPDILSSLFGGLRKGIIIVAGTNGKTTTSLMITTILEAQGLSVIHNVSGANLENGIVSSLINKSDWNGTISADWGVFEVDENSLPAVVSACQRVNESKQNKTQCIIVLLNLFRDQLDRYGEVDTIAEKWEKTLESLEPHDRKTRRVIDTTIIANADDPLIAHLGLHAKHPVLYFGINDKTKYLARMEHATDSIFCLNCGARLHYEGVYFSHIGIWNCPKCGEKRPAPDVHMAVSPLPGLYNRYNTLAAAAVARTLDIKQKTINTALAGFTPAFGRQEKIGNVTIFLSKNPAGFNESLRTVIELKAKNILLALNDRIPDGRDVSWIWDVDFEMIPKNITIYVTGDRALDMAVRLKYAQERQKENGNPSEILGTRRNTVHVEPNIQHALKRSLGEVPSGETLYILATYSAMLDIRKHLTGKNIL